MRVGEYIEKTNWLAHRWPITLETSPYGRWIVHVGKVDGQRVGQRTSREEYDSWYAVAKPQCLARFIASRRLDQPIALVIAGEYRLGRIPPELWCGYDAMELLDEPATTVLSAKARAMFPDWPQAVIRIVRKGEVSGLGLRAAPSPSGPRLRAVA
jgi:hypothetical protein